MSIMTPAPMVNIEAERFSDLVRTSRDFELLRKSYTLQNPTMFLHNCGLIFNRAREVENVVISQEEYKRLNGAFEALRKLCDEGWVPECRMEEVKKLLEE